MQLARFAPLALCLAFAATVGCGSDGTTPTSDGSEDAGAGGAGGSGGEAGAAGGGGEGGTGGAAGEGGAGGDTGDAGDDAQPDAPAPHAVQTVFIILMENHSAASVYGSLSAPFINGALLPMGAHATAYKTTIHPSEPNYIWLEAGDNLGITNDDDPSPAHVLTTTDHLSTQLENAGLSWKAYAEDIDGNSCPLTSSGTFGPGAWGVKHTPQLFFADVTDNLDAHSAKCIAHVRPFGELVSDLASGKVGRYNFITPNLCNDMHGGVPCGAGNLDLVRSGDTWLSQQVPLILASNVFKNGGLLLIVWDEGDEPLLQTASDGPLPLIAIGGMVKAGHAGGVPYTHSSTLKTIEEIFDLPLLRGAADPATSDLSDLFQSFP